MTVIATQPAETGDDGQAAALTRADIELAETGAFTLVICEACGAFLPPDATSCPTCSVQLAAFVSQLHNAPIHFDYSGGAR